ncbi:TerB family tellurite resistance protein [uncultured Sulfitobacter sp.]|uniref:tellurite resistance TerB family protein n=1 Tax=uncultured Sulfitobacter sp. TaxID=191468 RepID=UPI0026319819|nr:TerB family tellurite resistance protein [uncultured Sulfitobacter sp.]
MFGELLKKLTESAPAPLPDADARLALTALLVRAARSDNDYSVSERARILAIVARRYRLDADGSEALVQDAETLESQAPDTVRFTRSIKDAVPYEDRLGVIEALWKVVLADGTRASEEDALLRLVANLLGVSDMDNAQARRRVED